MKKSYLLLLLLMTCCAVFGTDIDIRRYYANGGKVQDLTVEGKNILRLTVAPGKKSSYRRFALAVEPGKNYILKFYFMTMSMLAATGSAVVIGKKRKEEN